MDPVTITLAMGIASKAFEAIKGGFQMGRDLESMSGDLSRWMGASSDVDQAEKQAKNPGVFDKVFGGGSVESVALQAYAAKKKLEEQRYELKMFLNLTHGFIAVIANVWIKRAEADPQPLNIILRENLTDFEK